MSLDMRISLQKLHVLTRVVELGGVGRAAEDLFVAQPVVSAHIRSLEQRIGTELFHRDGRHLRLTEAGEAVYQWAEEVLRRTRECDRLLGELSAGTRGSVDVGASMSIGSYLLPPVLAGFRERHPRTRLRLVVATTKRALEEVRDGTLDFAIVVLDHSTRPSGLVLTALGFEELVLVASGPCAQHGRALTAAELVDLAFVETPESLLCESTFGPGPRSHAAARHDVVLELGHPEAAKRMVLEGLGVALLCRSAVADELQDGTLHELKVTGARFRLPISMVHRSGRTFTGVQERLMVEASAAVSDRRAADGPFAVPAAVGPMVA